MLDVCIPMPRSSPRIALGLSRWAPLATPVITDCPFNQEFDASYSTFQSLKIIEVSKSQGS